MWPCTAGTTGSRAPLGGLGDAGPDAARHTSELRASPPATPEQLPDHVRAGVHCLAREVVERLGSAQDIEWGAPTSHAAIVARELGAPAVVNVGHVTDRVCSGDELFVDQTLTLTKGLPLWFEEGAIERPALADRIAQALARKDVVRAPKRTLLGLSAMFALGCRAPEPAPEPTPDSTKAPPGYAVVGAKSCEPVGEIQFICDLISPEDIAIVPGSEWIITSGNREGGRLHLVSVRDKTTTVLFPTPARNERLDAATYPTCPGPLDPEKQQAFRAHGLYLKPGKGAVHTLYVVHHGTRESIEVFEVDAQVTPPALTWVGCAPALSTIVFNSVVALPEGGFAATSGRTGDVWQYQTGTGWRRVPGSEGTAPNGLEISKDGRWLYIAGWAEEKLTRLSRGRTPIQKDVVKLGFRPDNVRMSPDGSVLFAAGHTDKEGRSIIEPREPLRETSNVARIDPQTLEVRRIFQHPAIEGFVASTTAIQIGNQMWLGSQRGERIAYFPAPK